jgi:hypothetical protein
MWFRSLNADTIKYFTKLSPSQTATLLAKLHEYANVTTPEISTLYYLPLKNLFFHNSSPNLYLFEQIKTPAVIELVGSDEKLAREIGTNLDVFHVGIAVRTQNGLIFYEASSSAKNGTGVIAIPLMKYLQGRLLSPTIRGINVQTIL